MTKLEALEALLEKVRTGEARGFYGKLCDAADIDAVNVMRADLNGYLDEAKALHEAVLPISSVSITIDPSGNGADLIVWPKGLSGSEESLFQAVSDNPARAWLMAILQALIERERGNA